MVLTAFTEQPWQFLQFILPFELTNLKDFHQFLALIESLEQALQAHQPMFTGLSLHLTSFLTHPRTCQGSLISSNTVPFESWDSQTLWCFEHRYSSIEFLSLHSFSQGGEHPCLARSADLPECLASISNFWIPLQASWVPLMVVMPLLTSVIVIVIWSPESMYWPQISVLSSCHWLPRNVP